MSWEAILIKAATVGAGKALDEVKGRWGDAGIALARKRARIAFTGQAGAGKSVLLDYLSGTAFDPRYQIPRASIADERQMSRRGRRRLMLVTIPGDRNLATRKATLTQLFPTKLTRFWHRNKPVVGVVHVVSNGLPKVRLASAERALVLQGYDTIERFQDYQRQQEISDLKETLGFVERSFSVTGFPRWLVIAVTKADLFADSIADAEDYYSGIGTSDFSAIIQEFRSNVGAASVRVDVFPVCSRLETYNYNSQRLQPGLDEGTRNALLS